MNGDDQSVPPPVSWQTARQGRRRHRQHALGRVEERVVKLALEHGEITPRMLHVEGIKNPNRILCRLAADGYLVRRLRGVYAPPEPGREKITRLRRGMGPPIVSGTRAKHALPARGIRKGAVLVLGKEIPLPGDVVLLPDHTPGVLVVMKPVKITENGVLVGCVERCIVATMKGPVSIDAAPSSPHTVVAPGSEPLPRVVGSYSRRTESARALRDLATPPRDLPDGALCWTKKEKEA